MNSLRFLKTTRIHRHEFIGFGNIENKLKSSDIIKIKSHPTLVTTTTTTPKKIK
jgi:hypothetical protein